MKRTTNLLILSALLSIFSSCEKEKMITEKELPAASREFINIHFPDTEISLIVKETETFSSDYKVYLVNGFEIDFTKSGDWDDVDGKRAAVPESILALLPQGIPAYVKNALHGCYIVEVNRERYGYEVGLSNGMELNFNSTGEFIRIDD
jgi:hypothetical protein